MSDNIPVYVPKHLHEKYRAIVIEHEANRDTSSYWLSNDWIESYKRSQEESPIEFAMKLSSIRSGIANFIQIMTGESIPVIFSSGKQSYATSTDYVVIGASKDPKHIDSVVGTALHESAHLILSKENLNQPESIPLYEWLPILSLSGSGFNIPFQLNMEAQRIKRSENIRNDLHMIINVMEDRRIDDWVYENAPGYRGYYDARYAHILKSPLYAQALVHPMGRRPLFKCFELQFISMVNPLASPDLLDGLQEIWDIIDLPNIRRYSKDDRWRNHEHENTINDPPQMILDAIRILTIMYKHSKNIEELPLDPTSNLKMEDDEDYTSPIADIGENGKEQEDSNGGEDKQIVLNHGNVEPPKSNETSEQAAISNSSEDRDAESMKDDENHDIANQTSKGAQSSEHKKEEFKAQLDEDVKKNPIEEDDIDSLIKSLQKENVGEEKKEVLENEDAKNVEAVSSSGAKLSEVARGSQFATKIIVFNKLSKSLLSAPSFSMSSKNGQLPTVCQISKEAVTQGTMLGTALASRIRILGDESDLIYNRQNSGRLDKRRIANAGYGEDNIFTQTVTERRSPVFVHMSIDASNSMSGTKWKEALTMAVALAKAADKIPALDVVVSLRGGKSSGQPPQVAIAFDSRVDKFAHITTMFPYLYPGGGTPEGLCFEALKDEIIKSAPRSRKFLINISDGQPYYELDNFSMYMGPDAVNHTATQVNEIKKSGIAILSYYVKGSTDGTEMKEAFIKMYGRHAEFINPSSIPDIIRTLNRFFIE